jgi:hypothetical protein
MNWKVLRFLSLSSPVAESFYHHLSRGGLEIIFVAVFILVFPGRYRGGLGKMNWKVKFCGFDPQGFGSTPGMSGKEIIIFAFFFFFCIR